MSFEVICIRPVDKTTKFLDRTINHIKSTANCRTKKWNVYPKKEEHQKCLDFLNGLTNNELVIFFGHGRSDLLYGAKGRLAEAIVSESVRTQNADEFFERDSFIDQTNISCLKGNKLIAVACNFGKKKGLGSQAVNSGLKTVLAFDEIPTSLFEFEHKLKKKYVSDKIVARYKGEISFILKQSITKAINEKYNFEELVAIIRYLTNKRAFEILTKCNGLKQRHILVDALYLFRSQIFIYGDSMQKIIGPYQ